MAAALSFRESTPQEMVKTAFLYPASLEPAGYRKVIVEVGPGRGDFLFHLAESNPDAVVIGIEIKRKRVDKLIKRVERRGLTNVMIIQDDAREAMPRFLAEASVDEIHVNFPDPWPKRRHEKHRAVSVDFLSECRRALKIGGSINFITDYEPYAVAVVEDVSSIPELEIQAVEEDVFPTLFALKWRKMGRTFSYYKFIKLR